MVLGEQSVHLAKLLVVNSMYWLTNFPSTQYFQIGRPEVPIDPAVIDPTAQWGATVGEREVYEVIHKCSLWYISLRFNVIY